MDDFSPGTWFLAANSAEGFYSAYDDIAQPENADRVWYIKGGPGNGKSTFMRRIAEAAEAAGFHAEYFLCSGDPMSLDGIRIRENKTVYVDATAPHVQEPSLPGVSGRYLDLSQFYKKTALPDRQAILALQSAYRKEYDRAYALLCAAGKADPTAFLSGEDCDALRAAGYETAARLLPEGDGGGIVRRFLSANTCLGFISIPQNAAAFGKVYLIQSDLAHAWLSGVLDASAEKRQSVILCPDPLLPGRPDGVIVPGAGVSFLKAHKGIRYPNGSVLRIRPECRDAEKTPEYRPEKSLRSALLRQACFRLKKAKELHDNLETLYRPSVDFKRLDRFTEKHIREQFGTDGNMTSDTKQ